jgi:hypothetical protein
MSSPQTMNSGKNKNETKCIYRLGQIGKGEVILVHSMREWR